MKYDSSLSLKMLHTLPETLVAAVVASSLVAGQESAPAESMGSVVAAVRFPGLSLCADKDQIERAQLEMILGALSDWILP